jgi:hypothetical protein
MLDQDLKYSSFDLKAMVHEQLLPHATNMLLWTHDSNVGILRSGDNNTMVAGRALLKCNACPWHQSYGGPCWTGFATRCLVPAM